MALGTEPFWSVEMVRGGLVWSSPEDLKGTRFAAECRTRADGPTQCEGIFRGAPFRMVITAGTCSDGMSDEVYNWTAKLVHGARTLAGCARRK